MMETVFVPEWAVVVAKVMTPDFATLLASAFSRVDARVLVTVPVSVFARLFHARLSTAARAFARIHGLTDEARATRTGAALARGWAGQWAHAFASVLERESVPTSGSASSWASGFASAGFELPWTRLGVESVRDPGFASASSWVGKWSASRG